MHYICMDIQYAPVKTHGLHRRFVLRYQTTLKDNNIERQSTYRPLSMQIFVEEGRHTLLLIVEWGNKLGWDLDFFEFVCVYVCAYS